MQPSHPTGLVGMGERPLKVLAASSQQPFASRATDTPAVRVYRLALLFLPFPITLASVRFRYVGPRLGFVQIQKAAVAVIALVRDRFTNALGVHLGRRLGIRRDRLQVLGGLSQRRHQRRRVSLVGSRQRHGHHRADGPFPQVHRMLHLVGQVR
jgi:hypothetical protein